MVFPHRSQFFLRGRHVLPGGNIPLVDLSLDLKGFLSFVLDIGKVFLQLRLFLIEPVQLQFVIVNIAQNNIDLFGDSGQLDFLVMMRVPAFLDQQVGFVLSFQCFFAQFSGICSLLFNRCDLSVELFNLPFPSEQRRIFPADASAAHRSGMADDVAVQRRDLQAARSLLL